MYRFLTPFLFLIPTHATADQRHHDHMIDVDSGEVMEFTNERIERLQAEIAAEMGYDIVHHRLELYVRRR